MESSQFLKLGIVALILCAAGYFVFGRTGDDIPVEQKPSSYWKCTECGATDGLTDRQFEGRQLQTAEAQKSQAGGVRAGRMRIDAHVIQCSKCSRITMRLAEKCPGDGEIFVTGGGAGDKPGQCPKCGWSRNTAAGSVAAGEGEGS